VEIVKSHEALDHKQKARGNILPKVQDTSTRRIGGRP
jgi:hypothetical protein